MINDTLVILADLYTSIQTLIVKNNSTKHDLRVSSMIMNYRFTRSRTRSIYKELRDLSRKTQFLWGIFKKGVCSSDNMFNDDPEAFDEDYDTQSKNRDTRSVQDNPDKYVNMFSFGGSSGTSLTLHQYFSNQSAMGSPPPSQPESRYSQHPPILQYACNPTEGKLFKFAIVRGLCEGSG